MYLLADFWVSEHSSDINSSQSHHTKCIIMIRTLLHKVSLPFFNNQSVRKRYTKHWNPKYKKERQEKVIKINFSELEVMPYILSKEKKRSKMKEKGIFPQKPWMERPLYISCTGNIFEPYVPPEGDGKFSSISSNGARQNIELLMKKTKSYQAFKKIKRYEEEFNPKQFVDQAVNIYTHALSALTRKNKEVLTNLITEHLLPEMWYSLEDKIIYWKFIKLLEPAKIVHARCTSIITDNNVFAQITVRLHSQQILAVFDRFGRLMHGSQILKKDVLEYTVFEKHLSNEYGQWRLHSKIIPQWMTPPHCNMKTFTIN